jgi:hypothetical protein
MSDPNDRDNPVPPNQNQRTGAEPNSAKDDHGINHPHGSPGADVPPQAHHETADEESKRLAATMGPVPDGKKRIKLTRDAEVLGQKRKAGEVVDVSDEEARSLASNSKPIR